MDQRLKDILAPDLPPFAAHVDYYGHCFQGTGTTQTSGAPLMTLREEQLRAAGSEVSSKICATAGHAWDNLGRRVQGTAHCLRRCLMTCDEIGFPSVNGARILTTEKLDRSKRAVSAAAARQSTSRAIPWTSPGRSRCILVPQEFEARVAFHDCTGGISKAGPELGRATAICAGRPAGMPRTIDPRS